MLAPSPRQSSANEKCKWRYVVREQMALLYNGLGQDGTKITERRAEVSTVAQRPVTAQKRTTTRVNEILHRTSTNIRASKRSRRSVPFTTSILVSMKNSKDRRVKKMTLLWIDTIEQDGRKRAEANTVAELSDPVMVRFARLKFPKWDKSEEP